VATALEALARIIQSEVGSSAPTPERIAVGWVARNRAAKRKQTIVAMSMPPAKQGKGRPFSSARSATPASTDAARTVLAMPASDDPTSGATSCFQPVLQDRLYSAGRYKNDANMVRRSWLRELDYYGSVGTWDLFGKKGGPGKRPIPDSWGLNDAVATPRGGAIRLKQTTITTARGSGAFPWLLLLLFVPRFTRRSGASGPRRSWSTVVIPTRRRR
jgi:hypothetical protein